MNKTIQVIDAKRCIIFFDFDNTIASCDVIDDIVMRFSKDKGWVKLEEEWKKGRIGSRECLDGQMKGLSLDKAGLDRYLSGVALDPYFKRLYRFLKSRKIKSMILSDNFDYILKGILKHNGIDGMGVYCNSLKISSGRFSLGFPYQDKKCRVCAHCKTKNLLAKAGKAPIIIYIGDGRSDICPSLHAQLVFAKDTLWDYYKKNGLACVKFGSLKKVYEYLKRSLQ